MSKQSEIRRRRQVKRSVGRKRGERLNRFFKSVQRNALETVRRMSTADRLNFEAMNQPVVFHLEAPYTPEFLRLRAKDLARLGLTVSVVPNTPEVSDEEVARVAERLQSTVPPRLDDLKE